jgi:hypothetical protein
MSAHECRESNTCCCYSLAEEPDEECPIHGGVTYPPRCAECGKFIRRDTANVCSNVAEISR